MLQPPTRALPAGPRADISNIDDARYLAHADADATHVFPAQRAESRGVHWRRCGSARSGARWGVLLLETPEDGEGSAEEAGCSCGGDDGSGSRGGGGGGVSLVGDVVAV